MDYQGNPNAQKLYAFLGAWDRIGFRFGREGRATVTTAVGWRNYIRSRVARPIVMAWRGYSLTMR